MISFENIIWVELKRHFSKLPNSNEQQLWENNQKLNSGGEIISSIQNIKLEVHIFQGSFKFFYAHLFHWPLKICSTWISSRDLDFHVQVFFWFNFILKSFLYSLHTNKL